MSVVYFFGKWIGKFWSLNWEKSTVFGIGNGTFYQYQLYKEKKSLYYAFGVISVELVIILLVLFHYFSVILFHWCYFSTTLYIILLIYNFSSILFFWYYFSFLLFHLCYFSIILFQYFTCWVVQYYITCTGIPLVLSQYYIIPMLLFQCGPSIISVLYHSYPVISMRP